MKKKLMTFVDGTKAVEVGMMVVVTNGQSGSHYNCRVVKVEKVGSKLITAGGVQFYLDGKQKTVYVAGSIYSSVDEYLRITQENKVIDEVRSICNSYSFRPTYEQSLQIANIMKIDLEKIK